MGGHPFIKMHGLGNDFVVLDARKAPLTLSVEAARAVADRRTGVGCDQIIAIEPSARGDAFMRIRNADGGEVAACGNATRCVAAMLLAETGRDLVAIETEAGLLLATPASADRVTVDMGAPRLGWRDIPLAREMDTLHLDLAIGPTRAPVLADPAGVSMGNPHAVFFVADAEAIDIATVGPMLETHPLFPERANIGVAQILSDQAIRLRVWERGVGLTQACGTGACAAAVAAHRRRRIGRQAILHMDGGALEIEWRESDDHVLMTGPAAVSFTGTLDAALLGADREAVA